jgi:ribosomal protein S18 acetylase RimI-like enzyme
MDVRLRAFQARDFEFVRELYFETMRWAIERAFGWNRQHQEENFSTWFKPNEARIITADGTDVGWIQQRQDAGEIFLGSIYVTPAMQRKGIGTSVIQDLLHLAAHRSQAVTLAVMKINPAVRLYQRLGFRTTHEDDYKIYMRADPKPGGSCPIDSM